MKDWISEKARYIKPDYALAKVAPQNMTIGDLYKVLKKKEKYSLKDAITLHKKQYSIDKYKKLMDVENAYSPERMLEILKARCQYLLERGSTLNNPHIRVSYFEGWEKITKKHDVRLRELVIQELSK